MRKSGHCIRFFRFIDIFGKNTEFQIEQKPKFKTTSGGIFTFIYAGLIIFLFFTFGGPMMYKMDPETNVSQIFQISPPKTLISKNDFFFVFGLQDSYAVHFIDEEIYSAELYLFSKNHSTKKIPLEPCSIENMPNDKKISNYFHHQAKALSDLYCISKDYDQKIAIQGAWDQTEFDNLKIILSPCNKSESVCKSEDDIKEKLKSSFFALYSVDNIFDLMDYEKPAKQIGRDYFTQTTYNLKKIVTNYLKTNWIFNDDGWISKTISKKEYFSFDSILESFEILEKLDHIIEFEIRKSYYETYWNRKYKKIQNVLAEMTGFLQIIFLALYLLSKPFVNKEYFETLTNSIYNFELDEEELKLNQIKKKKKKKTPMNKEERLKKFQNIINDTEKKSPVNNNQEDLEKSKKISMKEKKSEKKLMNHFFQLKESPLNLSMIELFKSIFIRETNLQTKKKQRKTGISSIFSQLDIKFILKKFAEIDKLKVLLLNKDQYHLFEYLPKPMILKNSKIHMNYANSTQMTGLNKTSQKNEIIHHNDVLIKAKIVKQAYNNIINKENMNEIDKKLIESLDEDILRLLNGVNANGFGEETKNHLILIGAEQNDPNQGFSVDREINNSFSERRRGEINF